MKKSGAFKHFQKDNKGSAILSVVLSMIFIVALGTALLYGAYMGMKVSAVSRSDKENFYDASAAMDEVLDGIRGEVSIALESAYTQTVAEYARYPESDPQELVQDFFLTELGEQTGTFLVKKDPFTAEVTGISLNIGNLKKNYIKGLEDDAFVKLEIGGEEGTIDVFKFDDASQWPVLIEDISLTYIDGDDFESNISTDIVIEMPAFTSLAVPQNTFALIAKGGLKFEKSSNIVTGGIYVGINSAYNGAYKDDAVGLVAEEGRNLTFKDGKVISEGAILLEDAAKVKDGAKLNLINDTAELHDIWAPKIVLGNKSSLTIKGPYKIYVGSVEMGEGASLIIDNPENEIWFKEIVAGKDSTVTINGNCYVADDLVLQSGSEVTLKGSYYGFGSDDAGTLNPDTDKSSSIYVDSYEPGKKASLNISGLDSLNLAGVSFIEDGSGKKIATGQSVAIKPDQLAYLVPAAAISNYKTNPAVLAQDGNGNYIAPEIDHSTVLWGSKTLADYIGTGNGSVLYRYPQGEGIGYVFINFKNQAKANEYFKDYFNARPESIEQYLDIYLNLKNSPSDTSTNTKGNTYQYGEDWENIIGSKSFDDPEAEYYSELYYKKMEKPPEQPFEMYVISEKLRELPKINKEQDATEFKNGNQLVAMLKNGDFRLNANKYKDLDLLIVANGNVYLNEVNFSGTIIANGLITLKLNENKPLEYADLTPGGLAAQNGGKPLSDYINAGGFGGESSPTFSTENLWAPEKLVSYSNWQKN